MPDVSPGLALFLGMIPGVGAIYNGQYAKGMVHAIIWGMLMSIADSRAAHGLEPVFVMTGGGLDGLHGVRGLSHGAQAPHGRTGGRILQPAEPERRAATRFRWPAIALIILGILLLLHTLDLLDFEYVARFWPVLLIAAGAYLLYGRFTGRGRRPGGPQ